MSDFFAVNGRVIPVVEATVSILDLGFLRGVGAFETFRTYDGGSPTLYPNTSAVFGTVPPPSASCLFSTKPMCAV